MDLWYPPDDEAPRLEWWLPLLHASAAARRARVPWPIHFDHFRLRGRIDRAGRPSVWVYHHEDSDHELYLDDTGQAYRFIPTPNAKGPGRFTRLDIRRAVFAAGLHRHVDPVWYDEPPAAPRYVETTLPLDDDGPWPAPSADPTEWVSARTRHAAHHAPGASTDTPSPARPRRPLRPGARRGHLTLIHGGRQAG